MKLVITEKNDAAEKIAALLSESGKPKKGKVYDTPVYRFTKDGEEWVTIGLRGHILAPDFPAELKFSVSEGWYAISSEGEVMPADVPDGLARPPFKKKKPFLEDGVDIKGWKVPSLPYLVWAPIEKLPAARSFRPRRASSVPSRTSPRRPTRWSSAPTSTVRASLSAPTRWLRCSR